MIYKGLASSQMITKIFKILFPSARGLNIDQYRRVWIKRWLDVVICESCSKGRLSHSQKLSPLVGGAIIFLTIAFVTDLQMF